jgi:hypothetical protein
MPNTPRVRLGWLRFTFLYTLIGAGAGGLAIVFGLPLVGSLLEIPAGDPYFVTAVGCGWIGFAAVSLLGVREPMRFAPVLLVQLVYKTAWLLLVFAPRVVEGHVPLYAWGLAATFVSYVVLDAIALPFGYLLSAEPRQN